MFRKTLSKLKITPLITALLISLFATSLPSVSGAPAVNHSPAWAPNTTYGVDALVSYGGLDYRCIQAHTSLPGWEPPNAPALWSLAPTAPPGTSPTPTQTRTRTPGGSTATPTPLRTATRTPTRTATRPGLTTRTPTRTLSPRASPNPCPSCGLPRRLVVGYWHNFDNGSGFIRLRNVSTKFDVVNVAFGEPTVSATEGTIGFVPYGTSAVEFRSDVAYLQSLGKKVIISVGGANGSVQLTTTTARDKFVNSMAALIETYGFNGIDIDFESGSLYLNSGDADLRNPTTPVIVNTIAALRTLRTRFGPSFLITLAPETFYVQMGYNTYGGTGGAYLPVIHATRDILSWLQVQHYNSGPIMGLDDQWHFMGNADFHVAMAEMVFTGFPLAKNPNNFFPPLRQDQYLIGLPANVNAGNGYLPPAEIQKALNYLIKGQAYGGTYRLRGGPYPNLRGVMTWSVNWDAFAGFEFSNSYRDYFNALP